MTRDYKRFTGSATLNFNAGDWLSTRAIVGVDQGWDKNGSLYPVDTRQNPVYFRNYLQNSTGSLTIERPSTSQVTAPPSGQRPPAPTTTPTRMSANADGSRDKRRSRPSSSTSL